MVRIVKKPEERKKEIVLAACDLFFSKGYEKTTMRDVMKQLNIAKGTIYHYFKSKDDLLEEVIDYIVATQNHSQVEILEQTSGNALQRIEQLVILSSQEHVEHENVIENLHKSENAGMHIRILAKHITTQAPVYEKLICQGCDEGLFTTDNPLECAEFILSGIQFLTDVGVYPWSDEQLQRRVEAFPGIVESLVNGPKGSFQFLLKLIG